MRRWRCRSRAHIEWFVQRHYVDSVKGDERLDPMFRSLLKQSGGLSAGVVGDGPAVVAQAEDVPVVYFAAEPPAPRGAALIGPRHSLLERVGDLRGKRIAVHRAAQAHYLLLKALEEAGVDRDEVSICFEPPERALQAFQLGHVDAWSIWDPWLSSARLDFGARVLRDATGLMPNSAFYLARRDFAQQHPELLDELLQHVQVAVQWVQRDPGRVADIIAPGLGLSPRALLASLERELNTLPLSAAAIAAQQTVADTLLRLELIRRPVDATRWPAACVGALQPHAAHSIGEYALNPRSYSAARSSQRQSPAYAKPSRTTTGRPRKKPSPPLAS
jgi:sulfonate transport system substrate-binding protein